MLASQLTDDAVAWSTVVLAGVTVALVGFNIYQAVLTRRALAQAQQDTQEAIKARIDQRAPRVVVFPEVIGGATRFWNSNTPEIVELHPGDTVIDSQEIGITGWFRLDNQGTSTALVTVPPGVVSFPTDQRVTGLNSIQEQRPSEPGKFRLPPGKGRLLLVQAAKTVAEWKLLSAVTESLRSPVLIEISVTDTFRDGIVDVTSLWLSGVPVHEGENGWTGGASQVTSIGVERTVRNYPHLS